MAITDTQSYGLVIRNIFYDAVTSAPFFSTFSRGKTKQLQVQSQNLPWLGVYILDELMTPDGDASVGDVRFLHALHLGFSVIIVNNDPVQSELKLDQAFWTIMRRLWADPVIMNLLDANSASNPDNVRVEGITRGMRRHVWGNAALSNELPVCELQYDITCTYRTTWPPVITDDLLMIDVTTGFMPGETEEQRAQRMQIRARYAFEPVMMDRYDDFVFDRLGNNIAARESQ